MPSLSPVTVVAALIESGGALVGEGRLSEAEPRVFLAKRSAKAGHGGLWELPGGKVEAGESPEDALIREIREELGVGIVIVGSPRRYEAEISGRSFAFIVYPSRITLSKDTAIHLVVHDEYRYFSELDLPWMELAPLDAPALRDWALSATGSTRR
jgi:8-oxo-dGTP diphosphatase